MKSLVLSVSEAPNLLMIFYGHNMFIILERAICKLIDWHLYKSLFVCTEGMEGQSRGDQTFQMANISLFCIKKCKDKVDQKPSNKL